MQVSLVAVVDFLCNQNTLCAIATNYFYGWCGRSISTSMLENKFKSTHSGSYDQIKHDRLFVAKLKIRYTVRTRTVPVPAGQIGG